MSRVPLPHWISLAIGNTGAATSCSVMDRVDLAGGGTINDGRVVISQSESECCKYCDNTVGEA